MSEIQMFHPEAEPLHIDDLDVEYPELPVTRKHQKWEKKSGTVYKSIFNEVIQYRRSYWQSATDCVLIIIIWICSRCIDFPVHKQCVNAYGDNTGNGGLNCGDGTTKDTSFTKPLMDSTLSYDVFLTICVLFWVIPYAISLLYLFIKNRIVNPSLSIQWKSILNYAFILCKYVLFSVGISSLATDLIKHNVGRPRPNFFAIIDDPNWSDTAFLSFSSGHTSTAFAYCFPLTLLWLETVKYVRFGRGNLKADSYDNPLAYLGGFFWQSLGQCYALSVLLCCLPTIYAAWVGLTRITDYWHHCSDVLGGAFVGIASALISFHVFGNEYFTVKIVDSAQVADIESQLNMSIATAEKPDRD